MKSLIFALVIGLTISSAVHAELSNKARSYGVGSCWIDENESTTDFKKFTITQKTTGDRYKKVSLKLSRDYASATIDSHCKDNDGINTANVIRNNSDIANLGSGGIEVLCGETVGSGFHTKAYMNFYIMDDTIVDAKLKLSTKSLSSLYLFSKDISIDCADNISDL